MIFPETYEIGVDEAGRGCFFGPVVAAAVVLPLELPEKEWHLIKDSKKLSEKKRVMLAEFIKSKALYYGIAEASHTEIDEINILKASLKAMHRAIHECYKQSKIQVLPMFEKIYVDGNHFNPYIPPEEEADAIDYQCVEQGDDKYLSIAAASILAKTYRDNLLIEQCEKNIILKQYDIQHNKGYGTKKHRDALKQLGPTEGHRMTYRPVKESIITKL
jgi:ribonuclease HII